MNRILISAIVALLLGVAALWWQLDSKTERLGKVSEQLETSQARADSLTTTLRIQRELITDAEELDRKHTQDLTDAQAENERLAGAVDAGTKRLRVNASCPAVRVPEAASATGMDDAATAELSASARQDYYALRRQITLTEAALAGLQAYVRSVCLIASP